MKTYANIQLEGDAHVVVPYVSRRKGRRAWTVSVYNAGDAARSPEAVRRDRLLPQGTGQDRLQGEARIAASLDRRASPSRCATSMPSCPYNTWPMAGGFAMQLSAADLAQLATDGGPPGLIFGSRIVAGGWEVTVGRFAPGRSVVRSFAYCAKRPVKVPRQRPAT